MKQYHCVEATLDIVLDGFKVRLWLDHGESTETLVHHDDWGREVAGAVTAKVEELGLVELQLSAVSRSTLLDYVAGLDRVNAAQIIWKSDVVALKEGFAGVAYGAVAYTVGFDGDHHG